MRASRRARALFASAPNQGERSACVRRASQTATIQAPGDLGTPFAPKGGRNFVWMHGSSNAWLEIICVPRRKASSGGLLLWPIRSSLTSRVPCRRPGKPALEPGPPWSSAWPRCWARLLLLFPASRSAARGARSTLCATGRARRTPGGAEAAGLRKDRQQHARRRQGRRAGTDPRHARSLGPRVRREAARALKAQVPAAAPSLGESSGRSVLRFFSW